MKKLFLIFAVLFSGSVAHAACGTISAGSTPSQIQTALNSCASSGGGTEVLSAGTYNMNGQVTVPCSVTLTGPVLPYFPTHYQTALFNSTITYPIVTTVGCGSSQHISYIANNGNLQNPTNGGGGFIYVTGGTTNLVIDHIWAHGLNGPQISCNNQPFNCGSAGIYFAQNDQAHPTQNVQVSWSEFGPENNTSGDCGLAMNESDTEASAGLCVGIMSNAWTKNVTLDHNIFGHMEQGLKVIETTTNGGSTTNSGNTNNFQVLYNYFYQLHRINFETQSNDYNPSFPTTQIIHYNINGDRDNTANNDPGNGGANGQYNYDFSIANGCGNPPATPNCSADLDFNVDIQGLSTSHGSGNEIWGDANTHGNYNYMAGYVAIAGGGYHYSQSGQFKFNNNIFNLYSAAGKSTNCQAPNGGAWNQEDGPASLPSCTGNTIASTGTGTKASVTPTISPGSGTFTGSQVVTLTNPGTNLDVNTTIWYTLDGSTPVPGSGSTQPYSAPFSITSTTTVKAVGMWGALNQPYSYPSGYGFVPSGLISATYTNSGVPTVAQPVLSPASETFSSPLSVTITTTTSGAVIHYTTDGTTPTSGSPVYTTPLTVSATTTVNAIGILSGFVNSSIGTATYTFVAPPNPVLVSGFLGAPGDQNTAIVGQTIQFTATGQYNDSSTHNFPDAYGNTAVWSIVNGSSACGTVNSTGLFTATIPGTCNLKVVSSGTTPGITFSQWTVTVSAKTLVSIALTSTGGVTHLTTGATNQLIATGTYNDSSTANITTSISTWSSSNNSFATITGGGLVTGVGSGSPTFTANLSGITSPAFSLTITSSIMLQSITVTSAGNVNVMHPAWALAFTATCNYSNGDQLNCNSTDSHGSLASWTSGNTSFATFSNNILKQITTSLNTSYVTATAGGITSLQFPMTYQSALPMIFNMTGSTVTMSGATVSISYK